MSDPDSCALSSDSVAGLFILLTVKAWRHCVKYFWRKVKTELVFLSVAYFNQRRKSYVPVLTVPTFNEILTCYRTHYLYIMNILPELHPDRLTSLSVLSRSFAAALADVCRWSGLPSAAVLPPVSLVAVSVAPPPRLVVAAAAALLLVVSRATGNCCDCFNFLRRTNAISSFLSSLFKRRTSSQRSRSSSLESSWNRTEKYYVRDIAFIT